MKKYVKLYIVAVTLLLISIGAVIFLIATGLNATPRTFTTLTPEVVKSFCSAKLRYAYAILCIPLIIAFIMFAGTVDSMSKNRPKAPEIIFVVTIELIFVLVAAFFCCVMSVKTIVDINNNEPRIETVQLTDKYIKGSRRNTKYYAVFSNGAEDDIPKYEFDNYRSDRDYYVIMCGDTCVDSFDSNKYELP